MQVSDNIYLIVFGESTLNDAVAIALANSADSIRDMIGHGVDPNYFVVTINSVMFFTVFFSVSLIIGFGLSLL
jgi:NhaP-type Na+/H+ or K+/H+ antiporter